LFHRGNSLAAAGKFAEAIEAYRKFLEIDPNHLDALSNLATALMQAGRASEAVPIFRRVLSMRPDHVLASNNLAAALVVMGQYAEAVELARRAAAMRPDYPPVHRNLGDAQAMLGNWAGALQSYQKLVELDVARGSPHPAMAADARMKLGLATTHMNRFDAAIVLFRQAIAFAPNDFEPRDALANAYWSAGNMDEALAVCRQTAALHQQEAKAFNNLGMALLECGLLDEALAAYDQAIGINPTYAVARSNRIFATLFHPGYDSKRILHGIKDWEKHCAPRIVPKAHGNDRSLSRRLRVGYISPDFCGHVAGRTVLPLLRRHDRTDFEVFCYSNDSVRDAFNATFRSLAAGWREIGGNRDDEVAEQVRDDKIDILVDMSLHMGGNRLGVFALKPAPVHVTFGYPGTTGISAMDYRVADPYLDPPDSPDEGCSEVSIRLRNSFWCYDPDAMEVANYAEPGAVPAINAGCITFGCLNNFRKINDRLLELWASVLRDVRSSHIRILSPQGSHRDALTSRFTKLEVGPDRVEFADRGSRLQYLESYRAIDIALDTLPYNGHVTSLDAMWMGVPVVTLVGGTIAGRGGYSQASNLGLTELVAWNGDDFRSIAVSLARDLPRLAQLRSSLRDRMKGSPLCDAAGWAASVEEAYREMWRRWCESSAP
jgi:predicted O-linked N-acetylglucosamine transferase (SPINDLY family)